MSFDKNKGSLIIRADAGFGVGAGHIMRCASIADAAEALGFEVIYAVSDRDSLNVVKAAGKKGIIIGGSKRRYDESDAKTLAAFVKAVKPRAMLVDSYAVTEGFFEFFRAQAEGVRLAYIDDLFSFAEGFAAVPKRFPVDVLVNYGFGFSLSEYEKVYERSGARLLVGPSFVPVRPRFKALPRHDSCPVRRILVTTGSTNPDAILERMAEACAVAVPEAVIDLVIGSSAEVRLPSILGSRCELHRGVSDLAPLMHGVDLAVSAAGFTLYELSCAGVPTVAIPIVDNQAGNIAGFEKRKLGLACTRVLPDVEEMARLIDSMASDGALRSACGIRMRAAVDGDGAERIASAILGH